MLIKVKTPGRSDCTVLAASALLLYVSFSKCVRVGEVTSLKDNSTVLRYNKMPEKRALNKFLSAM